MFGDRASYFAAALGTLEQRFLFGDSAVVLRRLFLFCGGDSSFATALLALRQRCSPRGGFPYFVAEILIRNGDSNPAAALLTLRQRLLSRDRNSYSAPDLGVSQKLQRFTTGQLTLHQGCWIRDRETSSAAEPAEGGVISWSDLKMGSYRRDLRDKAPKGRQHKVWGVSPRLRFHPKSDSPGRATADLLKSVCCRPFGARIRLGPIPWGLRPRLYAVAPSGLCRILIRLLFSGVALTPHEASRLLSRHSGLVRPEKTAARPSRHSK